MFLRTSRFGEAWTLTDTPALVTLALSLIHTPAHTCVNMFSLHFESLQVVQASDMRYSCPCCHLQLKNEKLHTVPMLRLRAFRLFESLKIQNTKPPLYYRFKSLLRLLLSILHSFSLKLHISSPVWREESCWAAANLSVPPCPQQQRWLQGEAHFPVSSVSQLTKNVSFSLDIRSCLTELKNLLNSQPVDGQEVRRRGGRVFFVKVGSSGACEAWESARLLVVQKA